MLNKMQETTTFFKKFEFLNHLSIQALNKLIYGFKPIKFNNGNYVYKEGDKVKGIYLILNGSFEILKKITVIDEAYDPRFGMISKIPKKSEIVRVATMTSGESFSLGEWFTKPYRQEYTIKWISSGSQVYFFPVNVVDKFNAVTRRKISEEGDMKSNVLKSLLNDVERFKKMNYSSSMKTEIEKHKQITFKSLGESTERNMDYYK